VNLLPHAVNLLPHVVNLLPKVAKIDTKVTDHRPDVRNHRRLVVHPFFQRRDPVFKASHPSLPPIGPRRPILHRRPVHGVCRWSAAARPAHPTTGG
jgi:hypothetical protein